MMHYSAASPVFQAFELTTRKLTGRFGAHDAQNPTFCLNCHSPTAAYTNEMLKLKKHEPVSAAMSALSNEGLHCTMCHSVREPDLSRVPEKGLLGDGIANASFVFYPIPQWVGPTTSAPLPEPNEYHDDGFWPEKGASQYLTSAKFCGSCHNVHVPNTPDTVTQKGFQRIENLYTEWFEGPWNTAQNPMGKPVSCTDCHMSLYGALDPKTKKRFPPGSFPTAPVAKGFTRERKHALHAFTAVSVALNGDDKHFPNQFTEGNDEFGFPVGQAQRRQQMLGIACEMKVTSWPPQLTPTASHLPFEITVTNTGTGHRVPSGFSQEREVWLEVKVTDGAGRTVYESGALKDKPHPETQEATSDGRSYDEDLQDTVMALTADTMEVKSWEPGPDFNLRPFSQLGLPTFNNAFLRKKTEKSYERVHFFTLANHIDNERSLPMLKPVPIRYEIPLKDWATQYPDYCGEITVEAKLNYRTLPPKVIRALIQREPQILNEAMIDRNPVVVMASERRTTKACRVRPASPPLIAVAGALPFRAQNRRWLTFPKPVGFAEAKRACEAARCSLPTTAQYDSLGLGQYTAKPGDNHDELWTERWASGTTADDQHAITYFFTGAANRVGSAPISGPGAVSFPHFCICEESSSE